ncbi:hypothetical protein GQ600_25351 [Phytophthora cactorum]|nr:hypothetical protein GQ600_25351 [Phytophthora cactorum]
MIHVLTLISLSFYQTNLFAQSFAVRTVLKGYTSETEGKYTCRKYVGEDEVTLFGQACDSMGCNCTSKASLNCGSLSSTSTLVETSFETIPVFHDSVCDFEEQIKILITSLNQSHATMNDHFCHLMSDLLLEEDWKSTFRR